MAGHGKLLYMTNPPHCALLTRQPEDLISSDGHSIEVWQLSVTGDESVLSAWAKHFREHYCADGEIDLFRDGTGLSRADYLTTLVFPDRTAAPGPSIRAGDFAEILVSDYVQFILGLWVPRGRYSEKGSRNESVKGADILGFEMPSDQAVPTDKLLVFEVKAQLSNSSYVRRLQDAVDDSSKDFLRLATTLNATKQRLHRAGDLAGMRLVGRFQNLADNPYELNYGAAAMLSDSAFDPNVIQVSTNASNHRDSQSLSLLVIRGADLMSLVNAIYERAANEA